MKRKIIVLCLCFAMAICTACGVNGTPNISDGETEVKQFLTKDFISDVELWQTPMLRSEGFLFEIQDGTESVVNDGLGESASDYNSAHGQERKARAEEWGYSITNLDGVTDGAGREIVTNFSGENAPVDRNEAVRKIFAYLENQYKSISQSGVYYSMNGHYPWHHYAGENGFDVLGTELGESIGNYQLRIAMNRGAARQYQTPWFVDFSMWHGPGILDYSDIGVWGEYSGTEKGHSLNLFERTMLMSYMAGADSLLAEAGNIICYDSNGNVTPYGEMCKKLYSFTQKHEDTGTSYTPYAVVLDYYHGMSMYQSTSEDEKAFNTFYYDEAIYLLSML